MKTVVNNGMPQSLSNVRRNLTRSESTQNKIANMLPVSQPQAYEVVVPKQLKKPLVVNRQRLRVSHKTLAKAQSQSKLG